MKIAFVQSATRLGEIEHNRQVLEGFLAQAAQESVDVVLFPEMWDLGFFPENLDELVAEAENHPLVAWMSEMAKKHQLNVVGGSIAVREHGKFYNRMHVFNRQGELIYTYDKLHLFSPGKEQDYFSSGTNFNTFELDGIPCGAVICYDVRFPELARKQALDGAKILFVPAQWPHPRKNHWVTLNKARAIENQMVVVSTNGCGIAGNLKGCGNSAIYDPWGEVLVAAEEEEGLFIAEVDITEVDKVREKIPVLKDRLPDLYGLDG